MPKCKTKKSTTQIDFENKIKPLINEMYELARKIFETGFRTGLDFSNMSWVHRLLEIDDPEKFFKVLKEQNHKYYEAKES